MPTTTADAAHETTLEHLRPTSITPHPKNPRKELGDLTDLAESIKGAGVVEPLIVTPAKAKGKYILIAGHRRHAAAKSAAVKSVPCIVRFDLEGDDRAQLEVMLTENLHRSDLNAIEEGAAYQTLLEFDDVDVKGLAARTGHKQKTIRDRVKLAKAPEALQQKLIAKQVTIEDALAIAEFVDEPEVYDRLAQFLGNMNFTWHLARAKEERAWQRKAAKVTKDLAAGGVRVAADSELNAEEEAAGDAFEWVDKEPGEEVPAGVETAAVIDRSVDEGYRIVYKRDVEKDEAGNPIKPEPAPVAESDAQRQAREKRERTAAIEADLRTAATVRRGHLAKISAGKFPETLLKSFTKDLPTLCLRQLCLSKATWLYDGKTARELLGLPPLTKDDDDNDHADFERHINKLSLDQLAITAFILSNIDEDDSLVRLWQWEGKDEDVDNWLHDLEHLFGYEFSEIERTLLADRNSAASAEE